MTQLESGFRAVQNKPHKEESAVVTAVEFHIQVQINFSKLQDSGDAKTFAKVFRMAIH